MKIEKGDVGYAKNGFYGRKKEKNQLKVMHSSVKQVQNYAYDLVDVCLCAES